MRPPKKTIRHRALWVGALVGLAALVWWALPWPGDPASPLPEPSAVALAPALPATVAPPAGRPPAASATPLPAAPEPASPRESPPPGTTPARPPDAPPIELPPTTQALAEEFYPGTTDWEDIPVDDSHAHRLRILPRRYNVVAPRPLAVWLEMTDAQGRRQPLPSPQVRMRALDDGARPWIDVPVKDGGEGEDEAAGDRRYTASLQPTREQKKALLGRVLIEARVDVPGVGTRMIPSVLLYTEGPRAKLTGRWRDTVRHGNLELEAELVVEQPGVFTLMAQVFGPRLEPLAWVKRTESLGAGRGTMTLEVFGKLLHDQGIDGPYRVRQVLLTRDQENSSDYEPGETVEEAHQTKPYPASGFSAEAYVPPPRTVEEVTAEHPSQRDKPPPERTRDVDTPSETAPPPPPPDDGPRPAVDLGH
jgi:hypothetical protein